MIPTQWREDFITSYVERYLPRQGITAAPILLRRFCPMLARRSRDRGRVASRYQTRRWHRAKYSSVTESNSGDEAR